MIFTGSSVKKAFLVCIGKIKPVPYDELVRQREAEIQHPDDLSYRPLVSFIIPVYNIEDRFLRPCLDSCMSQTYENFEVCISDDNSSLPSVKETLSEYEAKYDNFHVVYRTENGRISENTNTALSIAKGEFIALVDDDDTLE
ncbi:MAG: glycosyltransferase, partial [Lachnospiraceae bacterium]|nr:glycosyltransferase [Lachnospiraceae bacterium]